MTHEPKKIYWKSSEVAEILSVSPNTVRYWARYYGLSIGRARKPSGRFDRTFTAANINALLEIRRLLKDEGFTMKGVVKQLAKQASEIENMLRVI